MEMLRFEHPEFFGLFVMLPAFIVLFLVARWIRRKALKRFASPGLHRLLMPAASPSRPWIKFILFLLAFSGILMAAVNPQTGSRLEEARREGIEIVVALDVSRSMLARDITPNRLERARLAVDRLITQLEQDKIAIVVFAGSAHTQVPMTSDYRAARMILRSVSTESVSLQGTDIAQALERAMASFSPQGEADRVILLISDGESHEDDPMAAAQRAAEKGIRIHTVGVGSREGAPVPIMENGRVAGFLRDRDGNTVITRYDESLMRQLAEATDGIFRHGSGADMGLSDIMEHMRSLERETFETRIFADHVSRYYYFAAMALILLLLDMLISEKRSRWFNSERFFGVKESK